MSAGSEKQKLNTDSSTAAEAVGTHQHLPWIIFAVPFLAVQGRELLENIVHQDNKSSMSLETNGRSSSSERTRAVNVRFFLIEDCVDQKESSTECCHTNSMLGDHMTKGLQGHKFHEFWWAIVGMA